MALPVEGLAAAEPAEAPEARQKPRRSRSRSRSPSSSRTPRRCAASSPRRSPADPEARPTLAAAREALQRALHGGPAASIGRPASLEETRPAFLPEAPGPETAPALEPPPALAALPPAVALQPAAAPKPALPSRRDAAERLRIAIPEPPRPAVPPPAAFADDDGGEALSPITDDILEAAAAPPPRPAPPPPAAASAARETPPAGWRGRLLKPAPLAGAAGVLLLIVLGLVLWSRSATPPPAAGPAASPAGPAALPAVPPPPPLPPPGDRLRAAEEALAAGADHDALLALRSITPAEQRTLPADACRRIESLEEILSMTAPARLSADLQTGWRTGDLALLRMAARDAIDQPAAVAILPAATRDTLDRARRAAELYDLAEAASRRGDSARALEQLGELAHLVPALRDGTGLRDRAAVAVEAEAAKLVADARYEEALAKLEPLRQSWPERPGLKSEVETIRGQEKDEQTLANLLAEADNAEKRRRPDEGIDLLRKVRPTPHLRADYGAQMARLQALLDRVDGRPPTVELRDGYLLDYDRGTVANLSFRIRDDYKVTGVKVYARAGGGGRMIELPYKKDGFVYDVAIQPSFHQNGTVDFYVVASDYSGHETSLGNRDRPLQLKRRKGFRES